jgi:hypothetical protein
LLGDVNLREQEVNELLVGILRHADIIERIGLLLRD